MNKKNILLALLAVCLVATGISIRTFSFAKIDLGDLAIRLRRVTCHWHVTPSPKVRAIH